VLRKTPDETVKRIFYLYVPNTSESPEYLPGTGANTDRLYFDARDDSIRCPKYDRLAKPVTERLRASGASEKQMSNAMRQIEKGRVAADWRLSAEEIDKRLQESKRSASPEKNYWTIMLLISREGEKSARGPRKK